MASRQAQRAAMLKIAEAMRLLSEANLLITQIDDEDGPTRATRLPNGVDEAVTSEGNDEDEDDDAKQEPKTGFVPAVHVPSKKVTPKNVKPYQPSPSTKPGFYAKPASTPDARRRNKAKIQGEADRLQIEFAGRTVRNPPDTE